MSGRRFGEFGTSVPVYGAARPTVLNRHLQVHSPDFSVSVGSPAPVFCCGSVSGSGSPYMGSFVAPSTAATDCVFCLEGDNDIIVCGFDIRSESCDSGCELRNGIAVTCRGRRQVCDGIHHLLVEVPVYGVIVCRSVGGTHIVLQQ